MNDVKTQKAAKSGIKIDKEDAENLLAHIEGHLGFARDAIACSDAKALLEQAEEIEGWALALKVVANGVKG